MRISDWSSDVCSSDLAFAGLLSALRESDGWTLFTMIGAHLAEAGVDLSGRTYGMDTRARVRETSMAGYADQREQARSEEHTSELQSLMRISYAVFCLKKKNNYENRYAQQDSRRRDTTRTKQRERKQ